MDRAAVRQVINKGNKVKDVVESIYFECNPIPLFSKITKEEALKEIWKLNIAETANKPNKGFFERIRG